MTNRHVREETGGKRRAEVSGGRIGHRGQRQASLGQIKGLRKEKGIPANRAHIVNLVVGGLPDPRPSEVPTSRGGDEKKSPRKGYSEISI